ncbi:hypothetical protein D9756_003437 [Leucocoprinus leucothites]|uniref:Uncharacterized protein n=1 Tax=Leucocoprinus leucothites TaxID=201217 RepID=A0A8H5G6N9_9AGAR|nr:hypothetical protein D9756_003437 [Leucoagaricus leucothites]
MKMHTSLMSISVGAILLPAAYHFMEDDKKNIETSASQSKHILLMSHGLWSHKHLYHDRHNKKSQPLPVQVRVGVPKSARIFKHAGKRIATSFSTLDVSRPASRTDPKPGIPLEQRSYASPSDSQLTLNVCPGNPKDIDMNDYPGSSTLRFVTPPKGVPLTHEDTLMSNQSSETIIPDAAKSYEDLRPESYVQVDERDLTPTRTQEKGPQLSWTITLTTMVIVAIVVSFTAEMLVESMNGVSSISKEWIGLIVLPSVSAVAVQIMSYVVADAKSNWLEGVILICLYVIIAVSFWFYPGSNLPAALANCAMAVSDPV